MVQAVAVQSHSPAPALGFPAPQAAVTQHRAALPVPAGASSCLAGLLCVRQMQLNAGAQLFREVLKPHFSKHLWFRLYTVIFLTTSWSQLCCSESMQQRLRTALGGSCQSENDSGVQPSAGLSILGMRSRLSNQLCPFANGLTNKSISAFVTKSPGLSLSCFSEL